MTEDELFHALCDLVQAHDCEPVDIVGAAQKLLVQALTTYFYTFEEDITVLTLYLLLKKIVEIQSDPNLRQKIAEVNRDA